MTLIIISIFSLGASPFIQADIDKSAYDVGDIVTVQINMGDNPGIRGLYFDLSYDSGKLAFLNLSGGSVISNAPSESGLLYAHTDSLTASGPGGHLVVSWFLEESGSVSYLNGTILEVSFRVRERGLSDESFSFRFSDRKVVDRNFVELNRAVWNDSELFSLTGRETGLQVEIVEPGNNVVLDSESAFLNALYDSAPENTLIINNITNNYTSPLIEGSSGVLEDYPVPLDFGTNRISISLFDSIGAKAAGDEINVIRSVNEQFIDILSPTDHALVNTNMVKIVVSSAFDNPKINGMAMKSLDQTDPANHGNRLFYLNYYLKEGFNPIKAEVEMNEALYSTESWVYYHKDDSVFRFVTPGGESLIRIGDDSKLTIKGEISSLLDNSYLENTVHIQAVYHPLNKSMSSRVLVDMEQAVIKETDIYSGSSSAPYMFVLNHTVDISALETGTIELTAYKNKRGTSVEEEIHRTVYTDNNRLYIDLVQPNILTTDILDSMAKVQHFSSNSPAVVNSIEVNSEGAFQLASVDNAAGRDSRFNTESLTDIIRTAQGDLYALVNQSSKILIYRKMFGDDGWGLLLEETGKHGYDLCETDIGILVGVSNLASTDNSGLYLLQENGLTNVIIGEPIPHVQFISEDDGLISLYGNGYSYLYTFNIYSLEIVDDSLSAGITDKYSFDNSYFIKDFILASGGNTAIIQTLENDVYFYRKNDSDIFQPLLLQNGDEAEFQNIVKVESGEYSEGDYSAHLLIEEGGEEAYVVMEQRENRRFISQAQPLTLPLEGGELAGVDFYNDLFSFVIYDDAANTYSILREQILFNAFYEDSSDQRLSFAAEDTFAHDDLSLLQIDDSLLYGGFGAETTGLYCLQTRYPDSGEIEFSYHNDDIEGLVSFSFEVESSWIESDLLNMGFSLGQEDNSLFETEPVSVSGLCDIQSDVLQVDRECTQEQLGTGFELITVVFDSLQVDQDLLFHLKLSPVDGISPQIRNLSITKKVPVKLPRTGEEEVSLPINGYIYDPTVETIRIGTKDVPVTGGQFSHNYTINTVDRSTNIHLECLNGTEESADLDFTVQLFDSVNSLEDISFTLPESHELLAATDGVFDSESETIEVSGSYTGLIGAVTGYETRDMESGNIIDAGVFENIGITYPEPGQETGQFEYEKIRLYPDEQELRVYVENPGGYRSYYRIEEDQYPIFNYNLPDSQQGIELLNLEIDDISEEDVSLVNGINFNRIINTLVYENSVTNVFESTITIRGQIKSRYDLDELGVKSYNPEVLFSDGSDEATVSVDAQGRFQIVLNITLEEDTEGEDLKVAFIPAAPFLHSLSRGLVISADKSFANTNIAPDFEGYMDVWSQEQIDSLSKPVRVHIGRFVPEGAKMKLIVNYGDPVEGFLRLINTDEKVYRLIDSDGGEVAIHDGVKLGNNRIQWFIYHNLYTVSSSATPKNGMEDFLFTLDGVSTITDTDVRFPVDRQLYYGKETLPELVITKDVHTEVEVLLNSESLDLDDRTVSSLSFDFTADDFDLFEGRNRVIVNSKRTDGIEEVFGYELFYDTIAPVVQITGATYKEGSAELKTLSALVTEPNLEDAVIIYKTDSDENEYNGDSRYTYWGDGRFHVQWDLSGASISPTDLNYIYVKAMDHSGQSGQSENFSGITTSFSDPLSATSLSISAPYSGTPYFEGELGSLPFYASQRVKFYSSSIGMEGLVVNKNDEYVVNRPGSVKLGSIVGKNLSVTGNSMTVEAGGSISLYPGFSVYTGSQLHIIPDSGNGGTAVDILSFQNPAGGDLDSMSFVFYYRYEQEEFYYGDSDHDFKRILTLYDLYDGDEPSASLYLASKSADGDDSSIGFHLVYCDDNGNEFELLDASSIAIDKASAAGSAGWNLVVLSLDKTNSSFSLTVNDNQPIVAYFSGYDITLDNILASECPHYFGAINPTENGHYSIAQPFYVNKGISSDEIPELIADLPDLPGEAQYPNSENRREYNFDRWDDNRGEEFHNLTYWVDGEEITASGDASCFSGVENADYNDSGKGSLFASSKHRNYLNQYDNKYVVFTDSTEPIYYNISASANNGTLELTPSKAGVSGRYFFSKKQGNHGLTNSDFYSVYGTVLVDGSDSELEDPPAKAWMALLIDGKEERIPLYKGDFHLVFKNTSGAAPSTVKLYVETTETIKLKSDLVLTEGDYVMPPEAYEGTKPAWARTDYTFSPEGTVNLWYKPININEEGFSSYEGTIFDSEFVKIYTKIEGGVSRFEASLYGGTNNSPLAFESRTPVTEGWHNLQVSFDLIHDQAYFYIDGEMAASLNRPFHAVPTMTGDDNPDTTVYIGRAKGSVSYADGFIDSVSLSHLFKDCLYEEQPHNPISISYTQSQAFLDLRAALDINAGSYVNAQNIVYTLTSRSGDFRQIAEPASVGGLDLSGLPSGAYNFKAAMEINGYRFDKRFSFIKDNRPSFKVNSTTPLVIADLKGDILFNVSYDDSYLLQSNEGIEPGFVIQLREEESPDDIIETIYVYRDPASTGEDDWLWETADSSVSESIEIANNQLQVVFSAITPTVNIDWELKSFYFDNVFETKNYDFGQISADNQSGSIPLAELTIEKMDVEFEHKLELTIGNGSGGRIDEDLLGKLTVSVNVQGGDEIDPITLTDTTLDLYYEDILPGFGEYPCTGSLNYEGDTCSSEELVLNWITTEIQYHEEPGPVEKMLEIVDFSLLYLDRKTGNGEIMSTGKLYLEIDQNGIEGELNYEIDVYSVDNSGDYTLFSEQNGVINGSVDYAIISSVAIPQAQSLVSITLFESGVDNLVRTADLEISNNSRAPEVLITNTVPGRIAYNNVLLTWKGLLDNVYNSEIVFSYNFDKQGWTSWKKEWTSLELFNLEEGYHVFEVKAAYNGVESVIQSVPFFVDTEKPVFDDGDILVYPLYDCDGIISSVRISGSAGAVSDISLSSLFIDGIDADVNDDGSFNAVEIPIELDGENTILFSAYDEVGNLTEYSKTVENPLTEILFPGSNGQIYYSPVTVVGTVSREITSSVEIYLADPETGEADVKDLSSLKKAKINNDRTFFIEDVYVNPGTSSRSNETKIHLFLVSESGTVYKKDLTLHSNVLLMPINMDFSTHAVEGENTSTNVEISCTAHVNNISSWSIDFTGDGIYDEITSVDNPSAASEMSWNHTYSSLGLVSPRVRIVTLDGQYFSVSDQIIIHEQITESSNVLINDPLSMSSIRLEDGSDLVYVLAGSDSDYRIEVYEIGRTANYVSDKLYSISLDGTEIENPLSVLAFDKDHLYVGYNRDGAGYVSLLETNEFGNFVNLSDYTISVGSSVKEIEADSDYLFISQRDSGFITRVPLSDGRPTETDAELMTVNNEYLVDVGGNLALSRMNDSLIVGDCERNRVLSLDQQMNIVDYYDDFGTGEREFLKPALVESCENRIAVYDETRRDIQIFDGFFNTVATLGYDDGSDENYVEASTLFNVKDMSLVTRNEKNRLYYYILVISSSTNKLSMIRLPQWQELRAGVRNNKIVFMKDREVFTAKPDGSDLARILSSDSIPRIEGALDYPAISPDGRQIVFTSRVSLYNGSGEDEDAGNQYAYDNLYMVDINGENLTRIPLGLINNFEIERPEFSSNGDKIIFSARENGGNWQIYTYNMATGGISRLFISDENARYPYYSPDDRFVVFTTDYDGDEEVVIIDVKNVNMRVVVTNNNCRDSYPVWSALYPYEISNSDLDIESKIAFVSERGYSKSTYFTYLSRPSESDVRIVMKTGEETGGDPDSAAMIITDEADEADYPGFTGDGKSVVFEYMEDWESGLLRYDFDSNVSIPMNLPGDAGKPAGMKNFITNFKTELVDGNDLLLNWTPYTDKDIFYTVQFRLNDEGAGNVEKKFYTSGHAVLKDLEMGAGYLMRVCIVENGVEAATSLWKEVTMPVVAARGEVTVDGTNPYLVHLKAWKPTEETQWQYSWIIDNQEIPVQSTEEYLYEFSTSGTKTILLKTSDSAKTHTDVSDPLTVNIVSDIVPSIEYVLPEDSSYVELSAENSLGERIDWASAKWTVSGPGSVTTAAPVYGSQAIVPLDKFKHKVNVNLALTRIQVNGQAATDTIEKNITIDLDFKDVKPVITYDMNDEDSRLFTFSGSSSIGNIDWYNALWTIFGDGVVLHQQSGRSSLSYRFPENGGDVTYTVSLTIPRISDGQSETATQIVSVEAAPIEPVIDYEILTLEESGRTVGAKVLFSCSGSRGSSIDFSSARWSVPVAGAYGDQPTQIGPTAIYNLFNADGSSRVEVSLTLMRKNGTDATTVTEIINLSPGNVTQPDVIVKVDEEITGTAHVLVFDALSSTGPNINWEKTQWLIDGQYSRTGPVARYDLSNSGEEQVVRYICTLYRYGDEPLVEQDEKRVGADSMKPLINVSENLGDNTFRLSVENTGATGVDWTRTTWYIFDGNENVVTRQGANILHTFIPGSEAMGYQVMVEMFFRNDDRPFVGYKDIDIEGDELKPVITWDLGSGGGDANVVNFSARDSSGSGIDWSQTKWTFGDSSESRYGASVSHKYSIDSSAREYKVSLTLVRKNTNGAQETATVYKTVNIASDEIKPVLKAVVESSGYLVLTSEESEGRGLLLDRTSWLFEGEGDSSSTTENIKDGVMVSTTVVDDNTVHFDAGVQVSNGFVTASAGTSFVLGDVTNTTSNDYSDFIDKTDSFSTSNSHIGATCRRYVGNQKRIVVTMFVYRMESDGSMKGESITVNVDCAKAGSSNGVKYE